MPRRYFELSDDVYVRGRWHLGDPTDQQGNELNPWQFAKGERLDIKERMRIPLDQRGRALDFCKTPLTAAPVVNQKLATLLIELASDDIQLFPVDIPAQHEPYFLVNVLRVIKCIDDARCEEVQYWLPEDGRPEKTGRYRLVAGMRIDPSAVGDARIFRPWGWNVALIVRQDIKQAMERAGITGTYFQEV